MSYVNFKEERVVAKNQLDNRVKNNKKLFQDIRKNKKLSKEYFPDEKYSYKNFQDYIFGGGHVKSDEEFKEIHNKDIVCAEFKNCRFYNIKFKDCRFIGCYFIDCEFGSVGVVFENCIFIKQESDKLPSLNRNDNFSCTFKGCNIYGKFINCVLSYSIFDKCTMKNTNFELSDMSSTIIIECNLSMIVLIDVDLSGAKFVTSYIEDLEFRDKYISKFDEKTFFDKISFKKKTREEFEGIYMIYETIADKFKNNTLSNNFGEYYFLAKRAQFKTLKPMPKIVSFLTWVTCGYGERPLFAVYSSLFIIMIFAFIYLFNGISIDDEVIRYSLINNNFQFKQFLSDFNESLNLSVGMFAGVGFDNAQPLPVTYMTSNIEMLIGVVMMGIGIGTVTKKLVR